MSETERIMEALAARREIYAKLEERAAEDARPIESRMSYTREDVMQHAREAMELAINEARSAVGLPALELEW